jgi:hypothetical protein
MSLSVTVAARNLSQRTIPPFLSTVATLRIAKAYASPALALSLRILPRLAKLLAYLLIILNVRSFPFGWHGTHATPVFF